MQWMGKIENFSICLSINKEYYADVTIRFVTHNSFRCIYDKITFCTHHSIQSYPMYSPVRVTFDMIVKSVKIKLKFDT